MIPFALLCVTCLAGQVPLTERDVPSLEKYLLISSLLEKKGDHEGRALVLEAVPDLPGVAEAAAAEALVRAGAARLILNDAVGAEKNWLRVREAYPKTPAWPTAVLSLGRFHKKKTDYAKAIGLLQTLLKPELREQARWYHGSPGYYASLEIAECYEALKDYSRALQYAEMARDQYPFTSHCGACLESGQRRLAQRINELKKLQKGPMPLLMAFMAGLCLAIGAGVAWWQRRARSS